MSRPSRSARKPFARRVAAVTTGLAVAIVPVAGLTQTAASATPPTPAPSAPVVKGCATGALPAVVKGKPTSLTRGLPAGAWIWHDKRGYHVRVTHEAKSKLVFRGTVRSSGNVWAHRIFRNEKRDVIWRNDQRNAVKFVLRNHGGIDGIDFVTGCAQQVTITLRAGGSPLTTTQIHLGATAANPTGNPVVITRSAPA